MFTAPSIVDPVVGLVLNHYRAELAVWDVTCAGERPTVFPQRMLTVAEYSPITELGHAIRRFPVNVWAETKPITRDLIGAAMSATWHLPGVGPIRGVTDVTGPDPVNDDPAFTYQGSPLFHYYFTFAVVVKARTP